MNLARFFVMYGTGKSEAWTSLRGTRWDPPGGAKTTEERRRTYVFALEQAEQMFKAAASVDQATRPVLAYYGLNQAGRAVAAAASAIRDDGWRLSGHGIHARNLAGSLADIAISCDRSGSSGSFVRLSEILDSPLWSHGLPLRTFWDSIPDTRLVPLVEDQSRRTPLYVDHRNMLGEPHPLAVVLVGEFPPWVVSSRNARQSLDEYLAAFPGALGYHSYVRDGTAPDSRPSFNRYDDGWGGLQMNWEAANGKSCTPAEQEDFLRSITRQYNGSLYFFPALAGRDRGIHPLMAWWAVLHSLSMLARYQPAEWSAQIDVDHSRHAVALEVLLKDAMAIVPALIVETIEQVTRSPRPAA